MKHSATNVTAKLDPRDEEICFVHTGSKSKRQENEKREPESRRNKTGRTALYILFARIPQIFDLWPFYKICRVYIGGLSTGTAVKIDT